MNQQPKSGFRSNIRHNFCGGFRLPSRNTTRIPRPPGHPAPPTLLLSSKPTSFSERERKPFAPTTAHNNFIKSGIYFGQLALCNIEENPKDKKAPATHKTKDPIEFQTKKSTFTSQQQKTDKIVSQFFRRNDTVRIRPQTAKKFSSPLIGMCDIFFLQLKNQTKLA
jgi:hypothetical protein